MSQVGLPISRLIAVTLNLTSAFASFANLNSALVLGESDVIDTQTRIKAYNTLAQVAADFGTTAPEYLAAVVFFAQLPQPTLLYIGRWAHTATNGRLFGANLTAAQQALANFTAVVSGGFHIAVDGNAAINVAAINLSGVTNLNGVATAINTALTSAAAGATVSWTGSQFVFKSATTGATSKVVALTPPTSGTDISGLLGCNAAAQPREVDGIAPESALAAVTLIDQLTTYWYVLNTDACPDMVDADREAIAAFIEGDATPHIYGFTSSESAILDGSSTTDVASVLQAGLYKRTFIQFSTTSPYAVLSLIALFMTVDLQGVNTMITGAYKQEPTITPELLTSAQASVLDKKGCNYYATFSNGVPVIVNACMICTTISPGGGANEVFIDEIFGADGLANAIQVDFFNLLAAIPKLPQTDAGSELGANAIEAALTQFVQNGYIGPGTWNAGGFGQLATGQFLPKGYYVFVPPVASQAQAARAARASVPYQIAAKTAGAIHTANILLNVNP